MLKLLFTMPPPGFRKHQLALYALVWSFALAVFVVSKNPDVDLVALAALISIPVALVQGIMSAANVAVHRGKHKNGGDA